MCKMRKGMERCEAVCDSRPYVGKPRNTRPPLAGGCAQILLRGYYKTLKTAKSRL